MQVFAIAPSSARPLWVLVPVALLIVAVLITLAISALGARNARFEVDAEGLRLRGDFYGRLIPRAQLQVDQARRVDLNTSRDYQPARRTLGTGLPGFNRDGSG